MEAGMLKNVNILMLSLVLLGPAGMNAYAEKPQQQSFPFTGNLELSEPDRLKKEVLELVQKQKQLVAKNKVLEDQAAATFKQIQELSKKTRPLRQERENNMYELQNINKKITADLARIKELVKK
jgi:hypothetical protein